MLSQSLLLLAVLSATHGYDVFEDEPSMDDSLSFDENDYDPEEYDMSYDDSLLFRDDKNLDNYYDTMKRRREERREKSFNDPWNRFSSGPITTSWSSWSSWSSSGPKTKTSSWTSGSSLKPVTISGGCSDPQYCAHIPLPFCNTAIKWNCKKRCGFCGSTKPSGGNSGSVRPSGGNRGSVRPSGGNRGSVRPNGGNRGSVRPNGGNRGSVRPSGGNRGSVKPSGGRRLSSGEVEKECLDAHNNRRRKHKNTPDLVYDKKIAEGAQAYAELMARTRNFAHDNSIRNILGENLASSTGSGITAKGAAADAVRRWYNEIDNYDFATGKSKNGKKIGHFTQLVWDTSRKLGCGVAIKGNKLYVVARYSPPGNYRGVYTRHVHRKK